MVSNTSNKKRTQPEYLKDMAYKIRKHIVHLATDSPGAHVGGSMSSVEILTVLFFDNVLNIDPNNPEMDGRDYFIFSKGHSSASLYSVMAEKGYFPVKELETYKEMGSRLAGHPSKNIPGIDLATGSLGHGLPVGEGIALAGKLDNQDYKVFVVLGDGECQEGSIWESAMAASHNKLDNLVAIVDRNGIQEDGPTEEVMALEPFADKWRSFGWNVIEVDGHSVEALSSALHNIPDNQKPTLVIANTVKGNGLSFTSNTNKWHFGKFTQEEKDVALKELEEGGYK